MGFFDFNNARRRAIKKEENAFDYADRLSRSKEARKETTNINEGGYVDITAIKDSKKDLYYQEKEKQILKAEKEKRLQPYNTALGFAFSSKKLIANAPEKLKAKAVKGLYRSPFRR